MGALAIGSMGAMAAGGIVNSIGQLVQGNAEAGAASYNAQVQRENAAIATVNSQIASQAGEQQTSVASMKNRATLGAMKTSTAAGGLSVNTGSPTTVRGSQSELGMLDAYTTRANAVKEAYGYEVQAINEKAGAELASYESKADRQAAEFSAAGTLLGTGGEVGSQYADFLASGALNG